ncbi:MAG: hypothetical protein QG609_498 [Patescibacteria group bacterium]|nr:hypothetical protein [Patescibacteria group bacterium]
MTPGLNRNRCKYLATFGKQTIYILQSVYNLQMKYTILIIILLLLTGGALWWFTTSKSQDNNTSQTYTNSEYGFALQHPNDWTVDNSYAYDLLGPEEPTIPGVKFLIPKTLTEGTNLSESQTGLSVEIMPNMPTCTAYPFLLQPKTVTTEVINDVKYSIASSSGAAAGNLYEEYVYAISDTNPCLAVRYLIHSTNLANYDPGAVTAYDRTQLINIFNEIRNSIIVTQ